MDDLTSGDIAELLSAVGDHLADLGATTAIVVVGGGSLAVRGWVDRTTRDVDVIAQAILMDGQRVLVAPEPFPAPLLDAIARVARDYGLPSDWLNNAIGAQWPHGLPDALAHEIEWRAFVGLEVGFAGRRTLIALKLFAAVDQGSRSVHSQDLIALAPTDSELSEAASWVLTQDASEHFPQLTKEAIEHVRSALGRGGTPG